MNYNTMLMLSVGLLSAFTNIHAAEEEPGKCRPLDDSAAIVASITNWVERYRISPEFRVERDGTNTYIRGTVGRFPSLFSKYDIVVDLDSESQEAYCYGYLPTCVPDERRAEMVEFVFRAECSYGISPAALVLEDDGSVRCQSWLPFMTLKESPDRAIPRLVGSVMEKLYVCSQAVGPVLVGSEKPSCASRVEPVGLFGKEYESPQSSNAADTDMVLEKCFSDNEWTREQESDDWIVKRFAGKDAGANFIRAWFTDVKKDIGGIYDRIDYTLVVKNGTVGNVCPLPIDIPKERISDVADAAMHLNQSLKYALFFVDFDNGKLWCSYSLPASVLRSVEDASAANRYQAFIKTMALSGLAKNSGKFSELAAKKTQTDGDGKKTFSDGWRGPNFL